MEPLSAGLYLVGTPLGNLGDISSRAVDVLTNVDVIVCEDTREMKKLLSLIGVERGERDIVALHEHNERERASGIIEQIISGTSIAYASDAGMPAISDPGAFLVDGALDEGVMVTCIPSATAVTTAVALSGFISPSFTFVGFFPRETKDKKLLVTRITTSTDTIVFYESPKRLGATLAFLDEQITTNQRVVVCRELTKKFEEIVRGSFHNVATHFDGDVKGECVVVVEANKPQDLADETDVEAALAILRRAGVSSRDAVAALGPLTQIPKNRLKEIYTSVSSI